MNETTGTGKHLASEYSRPGEGVSRTGKHEIVRDSTGKTSAVKESTGRSRVTVREVGSGERPAPAVKYTTAPKKAEPKRVPASKPVPAAARKDEKRGISKEALYVLTAVAAALLVLAVAVLIRNVSDGREYEKYYSAALSAYDCGDYSNALSYLRKAETRSSTEECALLMADCYTAQKNYDKALELLHSLNVRREAVSSRIRSIEQKQKEAAEVEKLVIAGKSVPITSTGIVLDGIYLDSRVLGDLQKLYALDNLSASGCGLSDIRSVSALGGLTTLNLSDNMITDVSPLAVLTNLRTLYLDNNPIDDLSPLCSLTNLTSLSIKGMEITENELATLSAALPNCAIHSEAAVKDVSDITLGGVTFKNSVTELDLSGHGIRDISVLCACTALNRADLSGNSISDLSPLMDIPGLMWLSLADNSVTDLSPLMGISSIANLDLSRNSVSSTVPLSMLNGLVELHLAGNPIRNFSGLRRLMSLETLDLSDTGMTANDLAELYELKSLRLLTIEDNDGLSSESVAKLKEALPNCTVRHSELTVSASFGGMRFTNDIKNMDISGMDVDDISALADFAELEKLVCGSNRIGNIYVLQYLTRLSYLDLSANEVEDATVLSMLGGLEYLDLSYNNISSLTPLMGLTKLRHLYLYGNPLTEDQIWELQNVLSDCEIHF